ncbi:MAG: polymer-forming cytoskeletal protein [Elusimicrobiota bacterium]
MSLFAKGGAKKQEASDVVTIVGPEAFFHGVITVRGSLRVDGEVEGDVTEAHTVVVGKKGRIRGDVCAEVVIVAGSIHGDVTASGQVELKAGGRICGDMRTAKLLIEEGAVFEGHCTMGEVGPSEAAPGRAPEKSAQAAG